MVVDFEDGIYCWHIWVTGHEQDILKTCSRSFVNNAQYFSTKVFLTVKCVINKKRHPSQEYLNLIIAYNLQVSKFFWKQF